MSHTPRSCFASRKKALAPLGSVSDSVSLMARFRSRGKRLRMSTSESVSSKHRRYLIDQVQNPIEDQAMEAPSQLKRHLGRSGRAIPGNHRVHLGGWVPPAKAKVMRAKQVQRASRCAHTICVTNSQSYEGAGTAGGAAKITSRGTGAVRKDNDWAKFGKESTPSSWTPGV